MTEETIEIRKLNEFEGGRDPIMFYAKGHHDPEAFRKALEAQWTRTVLLEKVGQGYYRHVPSPPLKGYLMPCSKGPGAFPVTVAFAEDAIYHGEGEPPEEAITQS